MRKTCSTIALFFFVNLYSFAQVIVLYAQKKDNTIDTLEFGFIENASNSVNVDLNESDITNDNWMYNDIRILQKDSLNFECLYKSKLKSSPLYFDFPFESKNNYRNLNIIKNNDLYFEFKVTGTKWYGFTLISKTHEDLDEIIDEIVVSYGGCKNEVSFSEIAENSHVNLATINIFPFDLVTGNDLYVTNFTIKFKSRFLTNTKTNIVKRHQVSVFPNPVSKKLFIQGVDNYSEMIILNSFGQIVFRTRLNNDRWIDISHLQSGFYFYSFLNTSISGKFLKID